MIVFQYFLAGCLFLVAIIYSIVYYITCPLWVPLKVLSWPVGSFLKTLITKEPVS